MVYHGDNYDGLRITTQQGRMSPSRLYTLAEIEGLAKEYVSEAANRTTDQLVLSLWLAWLKKREVKDERGT